LRSAALSLLVGLAMLASLVGSATSARAQDDPIGDNDDGGNVQGNTYISPDFGYAISWDRTWDATDDSGDASPAVTNSLTLESNASIIVIEGIAGADPLGYVEDTIASLEDDPAASNIEPISEDLTGDVPSAAVSFDYVFEDESEGSLAYYVQAQAILDGEAVLAVSHITAPASYEAQIAEREDLLANLALDGDLPEVEGAEPDPDGAPDDNAPAVGEDPAGLRQVSVAGGDGDRPANEEDLVGLIDGSIQDINGYWAREFPLLSGGEEYTAPINWVTWTGEVETECGLGTSFGEDGTSGDGPFYCPPDSTIYYDLNFANLQLDIVPNEFVILVVMAHELGHHIQSLLGLEVCEETPCLDPNILTSQEIEYMADCWAGAWAQDAELRGRLGSRDVDDNIAQYAIILGGGIESADIGGHGRGSERVWWFLNGYLEGGARCLDTSSVTAGMLDETATPDETPTANETPTADETPAPDETAAPDETPTSAETTVGLDESVDLGAFTFEALRVELEDGIDTEEPDEDQFAVVYFRVEIAADGVGPFDYSGWTLVDGEGASYDVDEPATDQILSSAYDDGIEEVLEEQAPGEGYNLAMVFDVPADAEGLTLVNADAGLTVELGG